MVGLVLMGGDQCPRGHEFDSGVRFLLNCICVWIERKYMKKIV